MYHIHVLAYHSPELSDHKQLDTVLLESLNLFDILLCNNLFHDVPSQVQIVFWCL